MRLPARSFTAFAAVSVALATACSAAPDPTGDQLGGGAGTEDDETAAPAQKKSTTSTSPTNPPVTNPTDPAAPADPANPNPPVPAGNCGAEQSFDACFECCIKTDPAGFQVGDDAFTQCACAAPGICKAACGADFCNGQQPSQACITCLDSAEQCNQAADTACKGNAGCQAVEACITSSGCDAKP
jgi:hypothetical protein